MKDKTTVQQGYDELAETYAARRSVDEREITVLTEFLEPIPAPIRVLDAGCGDGTPILRQLDEGTTTVGLDFSHEQLRLAAEAVPATPLVRGDMAALPFDDDTFDAVTAYNAIIHVPLPEHQTVIDEFARVLRPDGRLLLSEAPEEFERVNENWLDSGVEMTWEMAGTPATREHLRKGGFKIVTEWEAPEREPGEDPRPPFFAAQIVD